MSKMNGSNGHSTALARRTPMRVTISRKRDETVSRRVDFFTLAKDMHCVLLAAIGWSTTAIAAYTGLTEGQVQYRIGKAEAKRRKGELTQRTKYRQGTSEVSHLVAATIVKRHSPVHKQIATTLDKRGLYAPVATGVLRNETKARQIASSK